MRRHRTRLGRCWHDGGRCLLFGSLLLAAVSAQAQDPGSRERTVDQLVAGSRAAIEAEHYHAAIATLTGVLRDEPRRSDAALLLARAYHLSGQHESASSVLEQALVEGPATGELLSLHARVLLSLGQLDAAREALAELKAAEPTSPWLSPLAGFIALAGSRPRDALERTRSAVDDPEAEAVRSATRGLSLLLDRPEDLNGYLAAAGPSLRPDVVLARYGAHVAVRPALEKAVASLPPGVRSQAWVAKVRLGLIELDGNSGGKREPLETLSRSEPNQSHWTIELAQLDLEERRYAECVARLRKGFADRPMPPPAALIAGQALERADQCDDSVPILESYLQSDPTHRAARTSLAHCYARKGRSEDAEEAYRRVLAAKPDDAAAAMGLSRLLRDQGRDAKAREVLEVFQHAKSLSDAQAQAASALTIAKEAFGREQWSEAILQARRALDVEPDLAEGHALAGAASLRAGDTRTARAELERTLVLDPDHGSARVYLARVLEGEGDNAGAVALLEKHMDLHPSHVPALFALCSLYQRQGALGKAEVRIRRALESKPHNETLLVMLREALAGLGRDAEALEVALRLAASNPSSSRYWSRVESLALSVGDQAAVAKARAKLAEIHQPR
jgi:predicted Zn-dependent protease